MGSILEELKDDISRRMESDPDSCYAIQKIVNEVGLQRRLISFLASVTKETDEITRIANRSYRHANGFDVFTLISSERPQFDMRLHIWWVDDSSENAEHVHDHSWNFVSLLLSGAYQFEVFEPSSLGIKMHKYLCRFPTEGSGYRIDYQGTARVKCIFQALMHAPSSYFLPYATLHRIRNSGARLTSTVLLHGPFVRGSSSIYSTRFISNLSESPKVHFSVAEVVNKISKYVALTSNSGFPPAGQTNGCPSVV
jgi:hypothetical protein